MVWFGSWLTCLWLPETALHFSSVAVLSCLWWASQSQAATGKSTSCQTKPFIFSFTCSPPLHDWLTTKIIGLTLQRYSKHYINRMGHPPLQNTHQLLLSDPGVLPVCPKPHCYHYHQYLRGGSCLSNHVHYKAITPLLGLADCIRLSLHLYHTHPEQG